MDDMAALSSMGCPELIKWRRESLASGRVDNLERRFLTDTSPETVNFMQGLLKWDPRARWTAAEALGKGKNRCSALAEKWWKEAPRAADKELLPTYPEVRNAESSVGSESKAEDYVFDFGCDGALRRPAKRPRPK